MSKKAVQISQVDKNGFFFQRKQLFNTKPLLISIKCFLLLMIFFIGYEGIAKDLMGKAKINLTALYKTPKIISINKVKKYKVDACQAIIFEGSRFKGQKTINMTSKAISYSSIDFNRNHSNVGLVCPINFLFADMILKNKFSFPKLGFIKQEGSRLSLEITNFDKLKEADLGKVTLFYTSEHPFYRSGKFYKQKQWKHKVAKRDGKTLSTTIPRAL